MEDSRVGGSTLPYRTTPEDLIRFVEARARGRDLTQIQTLGYPAGAFQGTLTAAYNFGLLDAESDDLTAAGRELALASASERPAVLRRAILGFQPYELLLEAAFSRAEPRETSAQWIETWWSTHGFGNSQTNREEGAFVFGKFVDFVGIGAFVVGRRGKPTRIEWKAGARDAIRAQIDKDSDGSGDNDDLEAAAGAEAIPRAEVNVPAKGIAGIGGPVLQQPTQGRNVLSLTLAAGRSVQINLPEKLTAAEKRRLLALIDLMVEEDDQPSTNLSEA